MQDANKAILKELNPKEKVRIALDAMGGDYGPSVVVEGAMLAAEEYGESVEVVLVGNSRMIEQ